MTNRPIAPRDATTMPGIHEGGHSDYLKVTQSDRRFREEKAKLRRRLGRFCNPRGIVGDFLVFRRRRQLVRRLRFRFEVPYSLFISSR